MESLIVVKAPINSKASTSNETLGTLETKEVYDDLIDNEDPIEGKGPVKVVEASITLKYNETQGVIEVLGNLVATKACNEPEDTKAPMEGEIVVEAPIFHHNTSIKYIK